MSTFKVKAFKQTSNYFEAWIEDPQGKLKHVKVSIAEYKFSRKANYLDLALSIAVNEYLKHLENTYYPQAAITAEALGSIHQNSFISKDFQIPKTSKK